jgi:hypothetical protein
VEVKVVWHSRDFDKDDLAGIRVGVVRFPDGWVVRFSDGWNVIVDRGGEVSVYDPTFSTREEAEAKAKDVSAVIQRLSEKVEGIIRVERVEE